MYYNTKIYNEEYLSKVAKSVEMADEELASVLGDIAFLHATQVMNLLPEELKGKLMVSIADVGSGDVGVTVSYNMKPSPEGPTTQVGQMFLPMEKLGAASARRPVISKTTGEQGIFVTGVQKTGRPSIQSYLMNQARKIINDVNEITEAAAYEMARQQLAQWFASNGVVYNSGAGRYQATSAVTLPWGESVPASRFIVGDF